jgi:hypothetical protein
MPIEKRSGVTARPEYNRKGIRMSEQNDKPDSPQEDAPKTPEQEAQEIKDHLSEMVATINVEGAGDTMVTRLDAISSQWRQTWSAILKQTDSEGHNEYKAKKYKPGHENPDLATRKVAYEFVVERVIDKQVTDIEPLELTKAQSMVIDLIRQAASILKVVAEDDYQSVKALLATNPYDLINRRDVYRTIAKLFLKHTYKLANV